MRSIKLLVFIAGLFLSSVALAGQWKPLCIEGGLCVGTSYNPMGPLFTSQGFLLNYKVIDYSGRDFDIKQILSTPEGLAGPSSFNISSSDLSTIELPDGKKMKFTRYGVWSWHDLDDELIYANYSGNDALNSRMKMETGPPVYIDGTVYFGNTYFTTVIYYSDDNGVTWNEQKAGLEIGADRFNLLKNPGGTDLWAITASYVDNPGSLWESIDRGDTWVRVDDGSFPADTVRVVHDPADQNHSYALTDHGLYLSQDRGVSWQETEFTEAIFSLLFIERGADHPRLVIIGTDTGVRMSTDEMVSWTDISSGLLAQPHSVTYGNGQLIATSESGYYSCALMDCLGAAQAMPAEEGRGLTDVIEFYHPDVEHYFITATKEEADAIDQGAAGPGWVRTGELFNAWSLGSGDQRKLANVCRFYGSMEPGPNSHFYSAAASECKFLMDLQELIPDDKPNLHFEGYAFSVPPVAQSGPPCPEDAIPVYRAYNNGFSLGIDINHRYMTDPDLVDEMVEKGWIDEGIAFCSPND